MEPQASMTTWALSQGVLGIVCLALAWTVRHLFKLLQEANEKLFVQGVQSAKLHQKVITVLSKFSPPGSSITLPDIKLDGDES